MKTMKKIMTITLFFLSFTVVFASCNKDEDCKPGTACTDTYSDGVAYSGIYDDDCDCIPTGNSGGGGNNSNCNTLCANDNAVWTGEMQGTICVCERTNTGGGGGGTGGLDPYLNPFGFQLYSTGSVTFTGYLLTKVTALMTEAGAATCDFDCNNVDDPIAAHRPNDINYLYQMIQIYRYLGPIEAQKADGSWAMLPKFRVDGAIVFRSHAGDLAVRQTTLIPNKMEEVVLQDALGNLSSITLQVTPVTVQVTAMGCNVGRWSTIRTPFVVDAGVF